MLSLNDILRLGGILDDAKVKLFRHVPSQSDPDLAWKEGWLGEYERMHPVGFGIPDYTVTFIPIDGVRARFLWVRKRMGESKRRRDLVKDPKYPFQTHYEEEGVGLNLERVTTFDDLEGRLIVDWGRGTRGYHQWRHKVAPKPVIQILPKGSVYGFPGYSKVFLDFFALKNIVGHPVENADWHAALSVVSGIYLITNIDTGQSYVGKASGLREILGRWREYSRTAGHGGNVELRRLLSAEKSINSLRWSILHVLPNDTPENEIEKLEALTKEKLGTRIVGFNRN